MTSARSFTLLLLGPVAVACGGSSGSPSAPGGTPPPPAGSPVSGFVYYDENGNGTQDPSETVRLPSVGVTIGGVTASTTSGGRFSASGVPNGAQTAQARPDMLPAYFSPGAAVAVSVPPSGEVAVPAVLDLGSWAKPNVYLAFGDSITLGEGATPGYSYGEILQGDLRAFWGKAGVTIDGVSGSKSNTGESRLSASLNRHRPAHVLVLHGTNDWNDGECRSEFPCYTVDALRSMVRQSRDAGAFPVVGTIPPVNPAFADRNPTERNDWVRRMNELVRAMARQEQVAVAEVHGGFLAAPSLPALFADDKHPNNEGSRVISRAFFEAITKPLGASGSSRVPAFFFDLSGSR